MTVKIYERGRAKVSIQIRGRFYDELDMGELLPLPIAYRKTKCKFVLYKENGIKL